jgi:succinoglycan biosynthesis protein ExoA
MDTQGKSGFQKAVAAAQNSKLGNGGSAHRSGISEGCWVDHGHHALMRVSAFNEVGGYDESFSHNEDAELDTRLGKAGHKIWLTAKTNLVYYPRSSPVKLFKQYMQYGKGRVRNILKHHTRPKLRQLMPVAVFPAALLALLTSLCWLMAVPLAAWAALCVGYGAMIGHKAKDKDLYLSGFAAMIMHFSWSLGFWLGIKEAFIKKPAGVRT